ncbi:MAG: hypothetical protein ACRDLO_15540 [Solirubrobacterales bacterium]
MHARIRNHIRSNVVGYIALFLVLTGGVAWASHPGGANTINSADIIDGAVREADVGQGAVASSEVKNGSIVAGDIAPESLGSSRVIDASLTGVDVKNDALTGNDVAGLTGNDLAPNSIPSGRILDGTLTGADVANNTLKGADIDESSLSSIGGGGPAGGDLTGTYPDPQIGADAVGAAETARGSVGSSELVTNLILFFDSTSVPPAGGVGEVTVSCPPGSVVLNGGAEFAFPSGDLSRSRAVNILDGWSAEGQNNGGVAQDLTVYALCLTRAFGEA